MNYRLAALALTIALPMSAPLAAEEMTAEEVKRLALEAILENPEIVMEAVAILREREEAEKATATVNAIDGLRFELEQDPNAPVIGNPEGDVTVVEFFDYNCPYCRQASGEVTALLEADPNVRLVFREWPILGEGSLYAARASLAAREQGKYAEFHEALMADRTRKDETAVMRVAEAVGLDIERLKADMDGEAVAAHIAQTSEMANKLGFTGTPSFVIGKQGVFGMVPKDELVELVEKARAEQTE